MGRSWEPWGRFLIPYERDSILSGIDVEITKHVGQTVEWWEYDPEATAVDDVYDVGSVDGGRRWKDPFTMICINVNLYHGVTVQDARGFYNTDVLRISLNVKDIESLMPHMITSTDDRLKDRVVFRGEVFRPNRITPKGQLTDDYTIFTIECVQINPEELINDPQFSDYAK